MKFRFIKEKDKDNSYDNTNVIVESQSDCLPEILEDFADFLRGCGFHFDGSIQVVNESGDDNE